MGVQIGIQLTRRCNMDCAHCFVSASDKDLDIETYKRIVSFAKACACSHIGVTGGEPTLHHRIGDVAAIAADEGLKIDIVTNGWNFVDFVRKVGPFIGAIGGLAFSLDGPTEAVHDENRLQGSYREVLRAISVCRAKGIPFGLRMAVTGRTVGHLEAMALLAATVGAYDLTIIPLQPTPRAAALDLLLTPPQLRLIPEEAARIRRMFNLKIVLATGFFDDDPLALCPPLTMNQLFVTADGEMTFCCQLASYVGAPNRTDVVADLNQVTLYEAHRRMIDAVARYRKEKVRRVAEEGLGPLDYCPCWYCLKYFRKVDWMREFPHLPWAQDVAGSPTEKAIAGDR